ncbi:MAG: phosphate acyltransferase [Bacteroidetes bacterium]|nr:phosphate acyltransferase [Bacteroidota bacterium]MBU1720072.1 phosphate acyltransferase [Bacteroidota bacterium]
MRIGLDAMGGDFAPKAAVEGAQQAAKELGTTDSVVLFGDEDQLRAFMQPEDYQGGKLEIVHTPEYVGMGDHPTKAISHKPNSSIFKGFRHLKAGEIDAFAGAGNTGAMLVGAVYILNQIPGIIRPAITSILPKIDGSTGIILDVGLNPDAKPDVLYQYAILGSLYAIHVFGIEKPKIALLNIGAEEEKGNINTQAAFRTMKDSIDFNFTGNIEANELFTGNADVVICDGFAGNIVLKEAEGIYNLIKNQGISNAYFERFNYENYGGSPILGVNGIAVVGHGMSSPLAIKNMILHAGEMYRSNLDSKIRTTINQ